MGICSWSALDAFQHFPLEFNPKGIRFMCFNTTSWCESKHRTSGQSEIHFKSRVLIWTKMRSTPRYREWFVGFAEDCLYSQWKLSYKKALSESSLFFRRRRHGKKACESIALNKEIKLSCQDQTILAEFYPANIRMVYKTTFRTEFLLNEIIQQGTRTYWDNINSPADL